MKLEEFLKAVEEECKNMINIRLDFDLGLDTKMDVISESKNRIKFSIIKSGGKRKK